MVNITDNLCIKQGNLGLKFAVYNQVRVIMARVRYCENREGIFARIKPERFKIFNTEPFQRKLCTLPRILPENKPYSMALPYVCTMYKFLDFELKQYP